MPTPKQIAKIHALKNEMRLADEEYRAVLAGFGAASSKELDDAGARAVIDALVKASIRRDGAGNIDFELNPAPGMASLKQQSMMRDLLKRAEFTITYPRSWMTRVLGRKVYPADGLWTLTTGEASKVIDALKRHLKSEEKKGK